MDETYKKLLELILRNSKVPVKFVVNQSLFDFHLEYNTALAKSWTVSIETIYETYLDDIFFTEREKMLKYVYDRYFPIYDSIGDVPLGLLDSLVEEKIKTTECVLVKIKQGEKYGNIL
jgi:hypothetical protein